MLDYGTGQPVILIHGWPLSAASWEKQIAALVDNGYRAIAYDRRGFGQSEASWDNYDYATFASDLHQLIKHLQLKNVVLVGFSMGGGEVMEYLKNYGQDNIAKIALISSIVPLIKQKDDNPDGVPADKLDQIIELLEEDRYAFLTGFHKDFYNFGSARSVRTEQLDVDFAIASRAARQATIKAAQSWMDADYRETCKEVKVPTLIVHGKADQTVPIATAGNQAAKLIANSTWHS